VVAEELGTSAEAVLVCSTGIIGVPLPIERLVRALPPLVAGLGTGPDAGRAAATAIMTTDTTVKQARVEGDGFAVGGMAKGAAMLAPDMATMLAVLTTDAAVDPSALGPTLRAAVVPSFNAVSIDGWSWPVAEPASPARTTSATPSPSSVPSWRPRWSPTPRGRSARSGSA
jgi:glutamate N-acetyltransferase / amino-acid N-acetyltransferase